jgi:hypothetical protein
MSDGQDLEEIVARLRQQVYHPLAFPTSDRDFFLFCFLEALVLRLVCLLFFSQAKMISLPGSWRRSRAFESL